MKRVLSIALACAFGILLIGAAVIAVRPSWLPLGNPPAPAGAASTDDSGLYCKEHGVPEKFCTLCHEELKSTLLLCKEHGDIPEDICTLCHPEVEKKNNIEMCPNGHKLPKAFCYLCGKDPSASNSLPDDGWCATHGKPEAFCPECAKDPALLVAKVKACRQPLPTVKLASAKLARQVGIRTALVSEEEHAHSFKANAETAYDGNAYADVAPRVAGFLREIRADLGKVVRQGDVLAVVDSAEVGGAKAQLITAQAALGLAQANYDRVKTLAKTGSVPAKQELETLTALNQSKAAALDAGQRLRNFGFGDADLARIVKDNDTTSFMNVAAPLDGAVVARHAVKGEPIQATAQLFAVTDTARMWLWIDVYEADVASVKPGQTVAFTISGTDTPVFTGEVNWVGTEVNPQTRTTRIRAVMANPEGRLRAHQFGQAEVRVGAEHKATVVPKAAVQRHENVDVVFLPQTEAGVYRPQRVVTKPTDRSDVLEVAWGLEPGQKVVTNGSFLLKTEIMKGAIGAGCCE